jgi:hypothetical protein
MSTATKRGNDGSGGGDKKRGGRGGKKKDADSPTVPKKKGRSKRGSAETPNADGSLKFLNPLEGPDSPGRFQGFGPYYHPNKDFMMTAGKFLDTHTIPASFSQLSHGSFEHTSCNADTTRLCEL